MKQDWFCEICGAEGTVIMPSGVDAFGGLQRIRKAHGRKNAACEQMTPPRRLRIRVREFCTDKQWLIEKQAAAAQRERTSA